MEPSRADRPGVIAPKTGVIWFRPGVITRLEAQVVAFRS
jgi:hypothetical protein